MSGAWRWIGRAAVVLLLTGVTFDARIDVEAAPFAYAA